MCTGGQGWAGGVQVLGWSVKMRHAEEQGIIVGACVSSSIDWGQPQSLTHRVVMRTQSSYWYSAYLGRGLVCGENSLSAIRLLFFFF